MFAQDRAQPGELGGIDLHLGRVAAEHHAVEAGAQVEEQRAGPRDDLFHQRAGFAEQLGDRAARRLGQFGERGAEFGAGAQAVGDEARHLVAGAADAAFGDVEREPRLPRDETGKFGAVGASRVAAAGLRREPVAQCVERRRLADQYLRAAAVAEQDQPRAQRAGMARVAEQDVAEFERAVALEPRDAPRDAQRHHLPRRLSVEPGAEGFEREGVIVILDREAGPLRVVVASGGVDPVEQELALDPVARVDDIEPVGRVLRHDGGAGGSVGHCAKTPPSLRGA